MTTTTTTHREMLEMTPVQFDHEEIVGLLESVSDFRAIWQDRSKQDNDELKASFATGVVDGLLGDILVHKTENGFALMDGIGRIEMAIAAGITHKLGFRAVEGSDQQLYDLSVKIHGTRRRIKETLRSWHIVNSHRDAPDMTLAMLAKDAGVKELDHMRKVVRAVEAGLYPDVVKGILKPEEAQELAQASNKEILEGHRAGKSITATRRALNKAKRDRLDKKATDDLKKKGLTDAQIAELRGAGLAKETVAAVTEHGVAEAAALAKVTKEKESLEELVSQLTLACAVMARTLEDAGDDVGERLRLAREFAATPEGTAWMVGAEARTQAIMAQWANEAQSANTNTAPATANAVPVVVITDKAEHAEKKKEWEDGYHAWYEENIGPWVKGADSKERTRRSKAREQYRTLFGLEPVYLDPKAADES